MKNRLLILFAVFLSSNEVFSMETSSNLKETLVLQEDQGFLQQFSQMGVIQDLSEKKMKDAPHKVTKKMDSVGSKYSPGLAEKSLLHKSTYGRKKSVTISPKNSFFRSNNVLLFEDENTVPQSLSSAVRSLRSPSLTVEQEALQHQAQVAVVLNIMPSQVMKRF